MPKKGNVNQFANGAYGLDAAYEQSMKAYAIITAIMDEFNLELSNKVRSYVSSTVMDPAKHRKVGKDQYSFSAALKKDDVKKHQKWMK